MSLDDLASTTAESAFKLFTGQFLGTLIAGIGSIVLTRILGPEAYGRYALSIVVPSFLLVFAGLGIDSGLTKYTAMHSGGCRLKGYVMAGILFKLLTALPLAVLAYAWAEPLSQLILGRSDIGLLVKVSSLVVIFSSLLSSLTAIFVGMSMAGRASLLNIAFQTSRSVLSPVLVVLGFGVLGAVAGYTSGYAVAAVLGLVILSSVLRENVAGCGEEGPYLPYVKELLVFSAPVYTSSIASTMLSTYQSALLSRYASYSEIGSFQAASNLASLLTLVTLPISTSLFPAFSRFRDLREASKAAEVAIIMTSLLLTPVVLFTVVESRDVVKIFYGAQFSASSEYLAAYVLIYLYSLIGSIVWGSFFQGVGRPKVLFKSTLIYSAVYIPSAYLLAVTHSVRGVIAAVLSASMASNVMLLLEGSKLGVRVDFAKNTKILLSAVIPALAITPLPLASLSTVTRVILLSTLYLALYVASLPLTGAIVSADVELLRAALKLPFFLRSLSEFLLDALERIIRLRERLRGSLFFGWRRPATG
jgi:O-antigen/teichoic acid export membrane protein